MKHMRLQEDLRFDALLSTARVVSDSLDSPADLFSSMTQICLSEPSLRNGRAQLPLRAGFLRRLTEARALFHNTVALLTELASTPAENAKR
jgi:hypothetical protein